MNAPESLSGRTDICVVGAGPVGLTFALALSSADFKVTVLAPDLDEKTDPNHQNGRAYSISAGCWKIWEALGLSDSLRPLAQPVKAVTAEASGFAPLLFDRQEMDDPENAPEAPMGYIIDSMLLQSSLKTKAAANTNISLVAGTVSAFGADARHAEIALHDQSRKIESKLVVACDGHRSTIRKCAGVNWIGGDYDACGIVLQVELERDHLATARQTFLKSGPFAVLPLPGNCANLVWTERRSVAEVLMDLDDEAFAREIEARVGDFLGPFKLSGPRFSYPLAFRIAEHFCGERWALAGDAAHVVHPLAGQGLNLGLKDVAALAEIVVDADRIGLDFGSALALKDYDASRRADCLAFATALDGLERVFKGPTALRSVAGLGMTVLNSIGPARAALIETATAEGNDHPRLMRGEPLTI